MPSTIEIDRLQEDDRDSNSGEESQSSGEEMDRLTSRSTEHIRTESLDSGFEEKTSLKPPGLLAAKRHLSNSNPTHRSSCGNVTSINEQTQLLIQKMLILEQKLQSMESQLKHEQVQRLSLEAKVVKLEKDNENLKATRAKAGQQLQNFAEIFYNATETVKVTGSTNNSPHPSLGELRQLSRVRAEGDLLSCRSRTDSLSSSESSQSRNSRNSRSSL